MAHKMSGNIKYFPMVIYKNAGINAHMNDQKTDEEKPRQAHKKFLADGGSEKLIPCHISGIVS